MEQRRKPPVLPGIFNGVYRKTPRGLVRLLSIALQITDLCALNSRRRDLSKNHLAIEHHAYRKTTLRNLAELLFTSVWIMEIDT